MAKLKLDRRTLLRGALGGGVVTIGLPPLEAMFNGNGDAYAAVGVPGKRFIFFFQGNGIVHSAWVPKTTGPAFPLSPSLMPLAEMKPYVRVVTGLNNLVSGSSHSECFAGVISGTPQRGGNDVGGPTPDQVAAQTLGADTRFRSLQFGVCREVRDGKDGTGGLRGSLSYNLAGGRMPTEYDPAALFDRLFMNIPTGGPGGTSAQAVMKYIARKQSILGLVKQDATRLRAQLPASDQQKMDAHLQSISDLERSIVTAPTAGCTAPARPGAVATSNLALDPMQWQTIAKQMADMMVLAFACDQTRVASFMLSMCQGYTSMPFVTGLGGEHHHACSHGSDLGTKQAAISAWHMTWFAYILKKLRDTPEGAGSLLDNTLMVYANEIGDGNSHGKTDLPHIVAGGSTMVKGNVHWRGAGETNCNLYLSCLQALGVPATRFGNSTGSVPLLT